MKRRSQQIELPGLPLAPMKLKEVPLENGEGQRLTLCKRCKGDGEICTATKTHTNAAGSERVETITIRKSAVASHKRSRWKTACEPCGDCGGAGYIKVGGANA